MFRSWQIIIRELCSLLKLLQYSQFNSHLQMRCCGSISWCVGMCCGAVAKVCYEAHLATAPQHIPTHHDMLPQHLVCKCELNCEYCNIDLARNRAPWWWSHKVETCRSVLKCFKSVLCEIICAFVGWWIEVIEKICSEMNLEGTGSGLLSFGGFMFPVLSTVYYRHNNTVI